MTDLLDQIKQKDDRIQQLNDSADPAENILLRQKLTTAAKHLKSLTQENQRLNEEIMTHSFVETHDLTVQPLTTHQTTQLHEQHIIDIRTAHSNEIADIQAKQIALVDALNAASNAKLAELEDALFDNDMELTDVKVERDL